MVLVVLGVAPALAHRLKVFATVEDGAVTGYAFFIGGGRPQGAQVIFRTPGGADLARTVTDAEGGFSFRPSVPQALEVVVNAGDGHVAEALLAADRFGPAEAAPASPAPAPDPASALAAAPAPSAPAAGLGAPAPPASAPTPSTACAPDTAVLAGLVDAAADRAVARQIRPLLEAYEAAEGRVRFNDVMGGIGMIVGLAGTALWVSARRRSGAGK
ncbi:cobalamin biosynthesis protein CbiM [Aquabacter sp. L1I39]|uniref:cobalamin biosynthesis protein CbiM n=1 Tax=Aquabacter sp. L1I39 TaxID=2820278 RepID=UPI001ADAE1F8|nr:cobalamin biosynthesis protein CbiM [Aquabacter sp. L1I39]